MQIGEMEEAGRVEEAMGKGNKQIRGQAEGSKATAGRSAERLQDIVGRPAGKVREEVWEVD